MYKKIIWMIAFTVSLALSQSVFAHSMCGEGLKSMVESLKLDAAQKDKIMPILDQLKSGMKDKAAQMDDLDKQINQQVESATMDQSAVGDLVDKKAKLITDIMKAKIMAKNQIYGILNADQKTKLHDKLKMVEDKMAAKFKECHKDD